MTDFDNTNKGAIWKNKDKDETHPNWPDFTGHLNVDGVDYYLNAWKRKDGAKQNSPSLNFTVKLKEADKAPNPQPPAAPVRRSRHDDFDDSIPF